MRRRASAGTSPHPTHTLQARTACTPPAGRFQVPAHRGHLRLSGRRTWLPLFHQPRTPGAPFFICSVAHGVCPLVLSWSHGKRRRLRHPPSPRPAPGPAFGRCTGCAGSMAGPVAGLGARPRSPRPWLAGLRNGVAALCPLRDHPASGSAGRRCQRGRSSPPGAGGLGPSGRRTTGPSPAVRA